MNIITRDPMNRYQEKVNSVNASEPLTLALDRINLHS
jgi:hypothetical protein